MRNSFNFPIKAFFIALISLPLSFVGITNPVNSEENFSISKKKITSNMKPASKEDTFLYRQIAVTFLCRARMAEIEFPKAIGISSATFADVITQKHGGFVDELPDTKITPNQLYLGAEVQIIEGSLKLCPDKIPSEVKQKFEEFLKDSKKKSKSK